MGKRTRQVTEDYESISNKIKKLEQKLKRTRRRDRHRTPTERRLSLSSSSSDTSRSSSSSSSRSPSPRGRRQAGASAERVSPPEILCIEGVPTPPRRVPVASAVVSEPVPLPSTSAVTDNELPSTSAEARAGTSEEPPAVELVPLDDELLLILGEDPSKAKSYGEDIQPDLAIRIQHIIKMGLTKEVRQEITDKHLTPSNCALIEAPILNPELIAAVPETVTKRDKGLEIRQKQRTSAISCVAEALTRLMASEPRNTEVIHTLMDGIKLLCDSQNMDSNIRRGFILSMLKKDLKDHLRTTIVDKLLFSENLAETIKTAKAISKSGAELKPAAKPQAPLKGKLPQKNLNWRGPPQNHRPRGNQRTKEPVPRNRPANSSKPSSRPARQQSNNRR